MKDIIFYAPLGRNTPQYLIGGGEKGCKRTYEILEQAGYKLHIIDKPIIGLGKRHYIRMAISAFFYLLKDMATYKKAIVYIVGFYEKNIYLEWLLLRTAKLFHHKTIYEARNGTLVKTYYKNKRIYRMLLDSILKSASTIFCQGQEYVDFINQKYQKKAVYTPNYVMRQYLEPYVERKMDPLQLIYTGRVTPSKNIKIILDVVNELNVENISAELTVIGAYTSEYKEELDEHCRKIGLDQKRVSFLGSQSFEVIMEKLKHAHYFVFTSQEKKEGHSNALTEAMAFGVVPVASNAGFNARVIQQKQLIVDTVDYMEYVNVIKNIMMNNLWSVYSHQVYDRVCKNYSEEIVKGSILEAINEICNH